MTSTFRASTVASPQAHRDHGLEPVDGPRGVAELGVGVDDDPVRHLRPGRTVGAVMEAPILVSESAVKRTSGSAKRQCGRRGPSRSINY